MPLCRPSRSYAGSVTLGILRDPRTVVLAHLVQHPAPGRLRDGPVRRAARAHRPSRRGGRARGHVRRHLGNVHVGTRDRVAGHQTERDHTRPDTAGIDVDVLVLRVPVADLDRGLVQRQREQRRGGELLAGRPAQLGGPARCGVVHEQVEGAPALVGVGHHPRPADHDRGPVVHRVVEPRPGEHDAVEQGERDADVLVGSLHQAARGDRAVQVQRAVAVRTVTVDREHGGQRQRHAVDHDGEVTDQRGVEDRVQGGPVRPGAFLLAPGTRARRGAERLAGGGCHPPIVTVRETRASP